MPLLSVMMMEPAQVPMLVLVLVLPGTGSDMTSIADHAPPARPLQWGARRTTGCPTPPPAARRIVRRRAPPDAVPGDCHPDELAQRLTRLEGYRCIQLTALPDLGRLRDGPDTAGAAHPRRLVGTLAAALGTGHALVV